MLKILIVEDDRKIIKILERLINKNFGCTIFEASNGLEGLSVLHKEKPDLILMDVSMPVMDGIETLEAIRADQEFKNIPVIIMSASNDKETVSKLMKKGISEYILKPLDLNSTFERIAKMITSISKSMEPIGNEIIKNEKSDQSSLLIIDPDENFINFFKDTFKEKLSVLTAPDGMKGLEIFLAKQPSSIIISQGLELLSETLFIKKVRTLNLEVQPKVFLSLGEKDSEPENKVEFDGIFRKSLSSESLTKELESVVLIPAETNQINS